MFSSFPIVLTIPGRSITVKSTQSGLNTSISTISGATYLSEILRINSYAFFIAFGSSF